MKDHAIALMLGSLALPGLALRAARLNTVNSDDNHLLIQWIVNSANRFVIYDAR